MKQSAKLKIFLMTRNEVLFIESWLQYHGHLFGFENLYIIDGSDQQEIFDIYQKYEKRGLNVFHTKANLNELEAVINEHMHQNKEEGDFLIKMDTDEFLVHGKLDGLSGAWYWLCERFKKLNPLIPQFLIRRLKIRNDGFDRLFRSLPITGQRYECATMFFSIPKQGDVTDPFNEIVDFRTFDDAQGKSFYHADSFCSTDLGGHLGTTSKRKGCIRTPLAIVHYHGVSVADALRSAKQVLISHGYIEESDSHATAKSKLLELDKQTAYNSSHKVQYYLKYLDSLEKGKDMTPESIYSDFSKYVDSNVAATTHRIDFVQRFMRKLKGQGLESMQAMVDEPSFVEARRLGLLEASKQPSRSDVLNFLLSRFDSDTNYLEIGVRYPKDNFDHIIADHKVSVDPGVECAENPVDFKMTSDEFFDQLKRGVVLSPDVRFNVIFIDGLHVASQVDRDIKNAFDYLADDGFVVLHDCNPPTEWHAREKLEDGFTPAGTAWNGTVWKAFLKWRSNPSLGSCCVDTDWGVGVLSRDRSLGTSLPPRNSFFEYAQFAAERKECLNLIGYEAFQTLLTQS